MPRPASCRSATTLAALLAVTLGLAASAHAEDKKADPLPPPDPSFLAMDDIDAPIIDSGRIDGVLHVSIVVKTKSAESAAELAKRMPELRAASLAAAIEFARLHASPFTPVNVARLSAMMSPPIKRLDAGIEKVLIVKVSATES
ncbi:MULTISPECIES: flagellar basal body-associated FliL family protein [Novosphingobium]|uniref:hypothetical protein n=1 Tax=unclassified Novosphingobium TaxID=2644732 RepID=UPI0006CC1578|nr:MULTISPECIES: hypothetical protein [unclassified Novosphingobium]KPH62811.1 hypothetical protein ADT71_14475 [Novosphingobium sp. ST904]TCM39221.1 hypothetical protein EDF59_106101 [Novosphingobium sp. ST904]